MNYIVKMKFGSHLYGTDIEDSDLDYKGIFMPTKEEMFLNRIPKSITFNTKAKEGEGIKNTKDDIDEEVYSLHYFIELACQGQTVAIDMLHATGEMIVKTSDIWKEIQKNRNKFYTKSLNAFIGYARKQAAKYGIKGSRLNEAKDFIELLKFYDEPNRRLSNIWHLFEEGEHTKYIEDNPNGLRQYQVCGKILQETMKVDYALEIVERYYKAYGKRAEQAAKNEGIDWKAVSHAVRAALEVRDILLIGNIKFPLREADLLIKIKRGELDYLGEVAPMLEDLMEQVEDLASKSDLPVKVNRIFWDNFIINACEKYYMKGGV